MATPLYPMQYRKPEQMVSTTVMKKKESRQGKSIQPDPTKVGTEGPKYFGSGKDSATHRRCSQKRKLHLCPLAKLIAYPMAPAATVQNVIKGEHSQWCTKTNQIHTVPADNTANDPIGYTRETKWGVVWEVIFEQK